MSGVSNFKNVDIGEVLIHKRSTGGKNRKKKMCQNIGDEVYLFYIFIIYIVDIGKIIIKECENDRMNDQEGSTKGTGASEASARCASHARRRPVASIPEITVCHVRQPWLSTSIIEKE